MPMHYVFKFQDTNKYLLVCQGTEVECYQYVIDRMPDWQNNAKTPAYLIVREL